MIYSLMSLPSIRPVPLISNSLLLSVSRLWCYRYLLCRCDSLSSISFPLSILVANSNERWKRFEGRNFNWRRKEREEEGKNGEREMIDDNRKQRKRIIIAWKLNERRMKDDKDDAVYCVVPLSSLHFSLIADNFPMRSAFHIVPTIRIANPVYVQKIVNIHPTGDRQRNVSTWHPGLYWREPGSGHTSASCNTWRIKSAMMRREARKIR